MATKTYDKAATKQTVSLTINSDLYARAKKLKINASKVAEDALAQELARREAEQARADIETDLAAMNAYAAKHGSFAELVREHYSDDE